jgi:hypothetical protein
MYRVVFIVSGDTYFFSYDEDILYLSHNGLTKDGLYSKLFKTLKGAKISATKYIKRKIDLNLTYKVDFEKIY